MSYDLSEIETQLAEVNAAIRATLASQEYAVGSRRQRRPEIGSLFSERRRLEALRDSLATGGSMASLGRIDPPR